MSGYTVGQITKPLSFSLQSLCAVVSFKPPPGEGVRCTQNKVARYRGVECVHADRLSGYGSSRNVAPGHPAFLWVRSPFLPGGPSPGGAAQKVTSLLGRQSLSYPPSLPGGALLLCGLFLFMRRVVFDLPPRGRGTAKRWKEFSRVGNSFRLGSLGTSPEGGGQGPLAGMCSGYFPIVDRYPRRR